MKSFPDAWTRAWNKGNSVDRWQGQSFAEMVMWPDTYSQRGGLERSYLINERLIISVDTWPLRLTVSTNEYIIHYRTAFDSEQ